MSHVGRTGLLSYCSSKHALLGLTRIYRTRLKLRTSRQGPRPQPGPSQACYSRALSLALDRLARCGARCRWCDGQLRAQSRPPITPTRSRNLAQALALTPTPDPNPNPNTNPNMNTIINQVCPGYIATDLTAGLKADAGFDAVVQERNPLGRWGGVGEFRGKGK